MPRAYVVAGALVGRSFELFDGATFGRGEDCDVVLPEGSVSRCHARLVREGERWVLVDAGSRNGIRDGDRRVERRALSDGDELALGKVLLRFRFADADADADANAPPPSAHRPAARAAVPARASARDGDATLSLTSSALHDLRSRAPAPSPNAPLRGVPRRRAELLAELDPQRGGFFSGDLTQRPAWMRWSLYLLALALAVAAFAGAFRLAQLVKGA